MRLAVGRQSRTIWWTSFALLFALGGLWSLASPLFSPADEPAHVVWAAAVARGRLNGPESRDYPDRQVRRTVHVPAVFGRAEVVPVCHIGRTEVTADCAPPFRGSTRTADVLTQVGRYPPAYYFAVGLPSLVLPSAAGVRVMRLVSAGIAAALLASAFVTASVMRRPAGLAVGLAVAVTPMVLFLAGSVNPSGVEIAAAIGLWSALAALLLSEPGDATSGPLVRAAVAGSALVLTRQLGPLYAALILATVAAMAGRQRLAALARRHDARRWGAAFGAVTTLAVAWIVARGTLSGLGGTRPPGELSLREVVQTSLGNNTGKNVLHMIGTFGWTDTPSPALTYYAWFACVGLVMIVGVARASRRQMLVLLGLGALAVVLPVILESLRAREIGFVWLGRYTLPLAVGIPILAATLGGNSFRAVGPRVISIVIVLVAVAHVMAFGGALVRYAGIGALLGGGHWSPPGSVPGLVVAYTGLVALYAVWLRQLASRSLAS